MLHPLPLWSEPLQTDRLIVIGLSFVVTNSVAKSNVVLRMRVNNLPLLPGSREPWCVNENVRDTLCLLCDRADLTHQGPALLLLELTFDFDFKQSER